jgi:hypothetical protein
MNFLIVSLCGDVHAIAVAVGLHRLGHRVVLWGTPGLAGDSTATLEMDGEGVRWTVGKHRFGPGDFDTVWLRRLSNIGIPGWVAETDRRYAVVENHRFFHALWTALSPDIRWIHSPAVMARGSNKIEQLLAARKHGLRHPATLMGNDPDAIRSFVARGDAAGSGAIYKAFGSMGWIDGDQTVGAFTQRLRPEHLVDDDVLAVTPGIYQERVPKAYELRVTFFGSRVHTVRIDSQSHATGIEDWRNMSGLHAHLVPHVLPADIESRCRLVMSDLGLETACFDFIVTPSGEHVFLELNQQGQFLWIEAAVPQYRLLRAMCDFLAGTDGHPNPRVSEDDVTDASITGKSDYLVMKAAMETDSIAVTDELLASNHVPALAG